MLDSEYARRAVGEVSVPFGICREPSNVAAAGRACPFRFRCIGCDHFRADASYLPEDIRPRFGCPEHPALWVTERGGRVKPAEINARFVAYRDALGLPRALSPHSLRHSWVTHLTEDGVDRRFIQEAVGHRCDTSTAIYTHVSGDFMNTALRKALAPAFEEPARCRKEQ